jgi:hypothetical protein
VEEFNEKKAEALIEEFSGLTKINSFVDMKPMLLFQKILKDNGIETIIKRECSEKYPEDNFGLYIENEKLDEVIPFLTGEKMLGKKKIISCTKVRQAKYYVDLLASNSIDTIIIKKKDSNFHMEEIHIYVDEKHMIKAQESIKNLKGLIPFKSSENLHVIERDEELLFKNSIKAVIQKTEKGYQLFVETVKFTKAEDVLNAEREWVSVGSFPDLANALYYKSIMDSEGIPCVIFNDFDNTFLLGEVDLMVDKEFEEKAKELINNAR